MPPFTVSAPQAVLVTAVVGLAASSNPALAIEPTDLFSGSTAPVQFLLANRAPINGGLIPTDITPVQFRSLDACRQRIEDEALPSLQSPPPMTSQSKLALGPVRTLDIGTASIKYSNPAVRISQSSPGAVELSDGEVLISASQPTTVRAGGAVISIAPGTVALIDYSGGRVRVLNAGEERFASIEVANNGSSARMSVGRQTVLATDQEQSRTIPLTVSKVSLWSAYRSSGLVRSLVRSGEVNDQDLSRKLIKTAAVLVVARGDSGALGPNKLIETAAPTKLLQGMNESRQPRS